METLDTLKYITLLPACYRGLSEVYFRVMNSDDYE